METFIKDMCFGDTTYRADYKPNPFISPDIKEKILIEHKHKGVPPSVLFSHHGIPHSWYLVSHYDEIFNRRPNPCLPPLRKWDKRKLVWLPNCTDHPLIEVLEKLSRSCNIHRRQSYISNCRSQRRALTLLGGIQGSSGRKPFKTHLDFVVNQLECISNLVHAPPGLQAAFMDS
ncbi:cilia- and flagella-associated protein 107 isoform X3 [Narcine bancroftii]|uniref:cilia- and flagella-associated protein 107 isoform X3 n=1 Tax=Narcine bancroftii TaxID=1343680 RepID=UPI0038315186